MFYLGVASSLYISIATVIVGLIRNCCTSSKTYKKPTVEYSQIEETEGVEQETSLNTGLLNGSVSGTKAYGSVKYTSEIDNVAFDSSNEAPAEINDFDIDTASIVYTPNDNRRSAINLFSKTL